MSKNVYFIDEIEAINKNYSPDENTPIFRYIDFSKYIDLLENRKLCFCNSRNFEDKFEGEMPAGFYHRWSEESANGHKRLSKEINKHYSAYISCWNMGKDENYALWKIYTNPETGVCIKTSVGRLKRALNNEGIILYTVKYIPSFDDSSFDIELPLYMRERKVDGLEIPISRDVKEVCKLDAYEYEKEVRAIYIENSNKPIMSFPINLEELIEEIYFSPFSSKWFRELVQKVTSKKRNLNNKVKYKESRIII